ncbi:hypothetical protein T484DRAFT_1913599 [Baffinella frigidus]|nr:hypothetical protein T484DRAFT_1913599 [Cryptophyta sp. CCMP2293]
MSDDAHLLGNDPMDIDCAQALLGLTAGRSAGGASGGGILGSSASEGGGAAAGGSQWGASVVSSRAWEGRPSLLSSLAVGGAAGVRGDPPSAKEEEIASASHQWRDAKVDPRPIDMKDAGEGGMVEEGGGRDAAHLLLLLLAPNHRERQVIAKGLAKTAREVHGDGAGFGQTRPGSGVGGGGQPRESRAARFAGAPSEPTRAP